jgi:hypothetical protein
MEARTAFRRVWRDRDLEGKVNVWRSSSRKGDKAFEHSNLRRRKSMFPAAGRAEISKRLIFEESYSASSEILSLLYNLIVIKLVCDEIADLSEGLEGWLSEL